MSQNNAALPMQDKDMLGDALSAQKQITDAYNTCANECATPAVRDELLKLLREEHAIQAGVFTEMQKRGWYPTQDAPAEKIAQTKMKFSSSSN